MSGKGGDPKKGNKPNSQPEYLKYNKTEHQSQGPLVLQPKNFKRQTNEPSGEAASLKISELQGKMGDRYIPEKAPIQKKIKVQQKEEKEKLKKNVLFSEDYYVPKNEDSRDAYDNILGIIQPYLGDYPDVVKNAAEEIISILKDESLNLNNKMKELGYILPSIKEEDVNSLLNFSNKISDFSIKEKKDDEMDENGMSIVFEDQEESEEEDEESMNIEAQETVKSKEKEESDDESEQKLSFKNIDGFWIQRQLSTFYKDANECQKVSESVLEILFKEDDSECENDLVMLLGTDKFSFIRILLENRYKIAFGTKLSRTHDEKEIEKIKEMMKKDYESLYEEFSGKVQQKKREKMDVEKTIDTSKQVLDLDSLSFDQGSHLMTNKTIKLPENTERKTFKGYEEIIIPPHTPPEFKDDEKLIQIKDTPHWIHPAFEKIISLNRVQSRLYKTALFDPDNFLLSAPTGCGKTNVAILSILHEIGLHLNQEGTELVDKDFKIVYIAPMKALVQEVVGSFSERFEKYGIKVQELTGDRQMNKQQIDETQIIVTTPEKWDIVTRKTGDRTYIQQVRLIIIDEIHLLHDERGAVLESIVSRTIRQQELTHENIRIIGLSATMPNYKDIAFFLRVKEDKIFHFESAYRPVPLLQKYIGITEKKALKRLATMNEITYQKVLEKAGKKQVIIFVHSRKDTAKSAKDIRDKAIHDDSIGLFLKGHQTSKDILKDEALLAKDSELKDLIPYGIGIHHAGLSRDDRKKVEDLFHDGHLQILVSTSTLAWGVNLPAHTVIIKGTQVYSPEKSAWTELSSLDVCQMIGRAGRIRFDTDGEGIIITTHQELQFYLSLLTEQLPIESQFMKRLADNLNAEIVLGTITNLEDAINWLTYTYLFVRMIRNPTLYGISEEEAKDDPTLEIRRTNLIHSAAVLLEKNNLIKYDRKTGSFQSTELGEVASHFYISHKSISIYNQQLRPQMSDIELFRLFSSSSEFSNMMVRREESLELQKMIQRVPIPIKESFDEPCAKVNTLLQIYISRLKLEGFALISDMTYITQSAGRIIRSVFEIALKRGWANLAEKALDLAKMVEKRMWKSQSPLKQFSRLSEDIIRKLEKKELTWDRLYDLSPVQLGELVRVPKMGINIYDSIRLVPRLDLTAHVQPITRSVMKVDLTVTPAFDFEEKIHSNSESFWIIVTDVDGEIILHHEIFILKKRYSKEEHFVSFTVQMTEPIPPQYFIQVISDRWITAETILPISFRHLILPEKYPRPTELQDLRPLSITALQNKDFEKIYQDFKSFNPIQTQVFNSIYHTENNIFIGAPKGSGIETLIEISILKTLTQLNFETGKCVYISPDKSICKKRLKEWKKFGKIDVRELTGDPIIDNKILESSHITISSPENWDLLSRKWKTRQSIQKVKLFVVDDLHLLGAEIGPIIETILSRMRYITSQLDNHSVRIIGTSTSLANAKDIGDWLGVKSQDFYNFHPISRPTPLDLQIQGFNQLNLTGRTIAMIRPSNNAIEKSNGKPVIIFVPKAKLSKMVALELIINRESNVDIQKFKEFIQDKDLEKCLESGIGYLYEGIIDEEQKVVENLFRKCLIQVLICTYSLCWNLDHQAHTVVIMGTQYYEGREHRYSDYKLHDIIEMISKASRPNIDTSNRCLVLTHSSKFEYYNKFLNDPYPIESHLDLVLSDHLNAEIVSKTITNKQEAVDYLTWTFLYRRIRQNPNYYNLHGTSHRHISDYLSELVEATLNELAQSKCIQIDEDSVSPLNLGMISSHYYVKFSTIELYNTSLTNTTKLRGLIEILSASSEFEKVIIRSGDEDVLYKLSQHCPLKIENAKFNDPHTKVNLLLQSHFSRIKLNSELEQDKQTILIECQKLIQALVDVISSNKWLNPALSAMELSQMIIQAMWDKDPILLQLPYFNKELCQKFSEKNVNSILEIFDMNPKERVSLLKFDKDEMDDISSALNRYPNLELNFKLVETQVKNGEIASMNIQVNVPEEIETPVESPFYPKKKFEEWWLVIGEPSKNQLIAIKRVPIKKETKVKLDFIVQDEGEHDYKLYFMCDSYLGCDQEFEFKLNVLKNEEEQDEMNEEE